MNEKRTFVLSEESRITLAVSDDGYWLNDEKLPASWCTVLDFAMLLSCDYQDSSIHARDILCLRARGKWFRWSAMNECSIYIRRTWEWVD